MTTPSTPSTGGVWVKITCAEADVLRHREDVRPGASRTDLYGEYGPPEVFTEWHDESERPVLREHRYPSGNHDGTGPDRKPCEHYRWEVSDV